MGMSIDEATRILNNFNGLSLTDEDELSEAIRKAIDIMRKYQKIQRIYSDVLVNNDGTHFLENVSEVLEDGKMG